MEIPKTKFTFNNTIIFKKWCLGVKYIPKYLEQDVVEDILRYGKGIIEIDDSKIFESEPIFPNPIPLERSI